MLKAYERRNRRAQDERLALPAQYLCVCGKDITEHDFDRLDVPGTCEGFVRAGAPQQENNEKGPIEAGTA